MRKKKPFRAVSGTEKGKETLVLLSLCAAAGFLSFFRLAANDLWWDEFGNFSMACQEPGKISIGSLLIVPHPPLYFQLLHIVSRLGHSEFLLRLLSAVCGTLCVPVFYLFCRAAAGRRTALLAAMLLALSPLRVWYSQEASPHIMAFLFALAGNYQLYVFLTRRPQALRSFILWVAFTALTFYTSNHSLLLLLAQAVFLLLVWEDTDAASRRMYPLGVALQLVLYAPQMLSFLSSLKEVKTCFWILPVTPWAPFHSTMNFFLGYSGDRLMSFTVLAVFLAGLGMVFRAAAPRPVRSVFLAFGLVPLLAVFFIHRWVHVYIDRHNMLFMPAFFMAASAGLLAVRSAVIRRACIGGLCAVMGFALVNYWRNVMPLAGYGHAGVYIKKDMGNIAEFLAKNVREDDLVAVGCMNIMGLLDYYLPSGGKICYLCARHDDYWRRRMDAYRPVRGDGLQSVDVALLRGKIVFLDSAESERVALDSLPARIWFLQTNWQRDGGFDDNAVAAAAILAKRYVVIRSVWMDGVLINLYARDCFRRDGNEIQ